MTSTTRQRGRKAVEDFGDDLGEAETLLRRAATETGQRASDLLAQVAAKLESARSTLRELPEQAMERATAAARDTDDYVRDKPWQAIGVAAAVAFLIGVLVSRR